MTSLPLFPAHQTRSLSLCYLLSSLSICLVCLVFVPAPSPAFWVRGKHSTAKLHPYPTFSFEGDGTLGWRLCSLVSIPWASFIGESVVSLLAWTIWGRVLLPGLLKGFIFHQLSSDGQRCGFFIFYSPQQESD